MRQIYARGSTLFMVLSIALLTPYTSYGAGLFSTAIVPGKGSACYCNGFAMSWGCILEVLQNVINACISLAIVFLVVWIAYAGFSMMTSGGVSEARTIAKTRILNSVIGIVVLLAAWLVVSSIMKFIYNPAANKDGVTLGEWNAILAPLAEDKCIKVTEPDGLLSQSLSIVTTATPGTTPSDQNQSGASVGGGTCTVQNTGACAVSNMAAFGSAASQASQICNAESSGVAGRASGTDKLADGTPYSWGLFQINISANSVGGLPCPNAFSIKSCTVRKCGPGSGAHVIDSALYNRCVAAAKQVGPNVMAAVSIYKSQGNSSWRPWGTSKKCNLALSEIKSLAVLKSCVQNKLHIYES